MLNMDATDLQAKLNEIANQAKKRNPEGFTSPTLKPSRTSDTFGLTHTTASGQKIIFLSNAVNIPM